MPAPASRSLLKLVSFTTEAATTLRVTGELDVNTAQLLCSTVTSSL